MQNENQEQFSISDQDLEMIYKYLSITFNTLDEDEKNMWYSILERFDPDFFDIDEEDDDNDN